MSLPELFNRTQVRIYSEGAPAGPEGVAVPAGEAGATEGPLPGVGNSLDFRLERQKQTQWCWAAVTVSIARFYDGGSTLTQCQLVNEEFGAEAHGFNCCASGGSADCNQPWYLNQALERAGLIEPDGMKAGTTSFEDFGREVDARRPLACRIGWDKGGGHFIVLTAYSTDFGPAVPVQWVSGEDPIAGPFDYHYVKFLVSYGSADKGKWSHSYFTRP